MKQWVKSIVKRITRRSLLRFFPPDEIRGILEDETGPLTGIKAPLTLCEDGLATVHNADFLQDPRFRAAYEKGYATGSWGGHIRYRAYVVCWAAERGSALPGDFVECGVNRGGYARTVISYVDFGKLPKTFYLLDTFSGLVAGCISEEEKKRGIRPGGYPDCYEAVKQTFREFPNVKIIRGIVPDTLSQVPSQQIAFLSLDMNCAAPEIAAAEFFWPKLVPGAVVVLDDYGWSVHYEQKKAFDAFAKKHGVSVLSLPTGQGLLIKP